MSTVVQDMQAVLPSMSPPSDKGVAHLTNDKLNRSVAYCGYRRVGSHSAHGIVEEGQTHCPCGVPICPACLAVRNSYHRSGAWEGPDA